MAKINMDTEPRFKALMKELGFKKKGDFFVREFEESLQTLDFGYATNGEKYVRYYCSSYGVNYPKIVEAARKMDIYVYGMGGHIGYLMPQHHFIEWRMAESDTDEFYVNMINEIANVLKEHVVPYMEKYSTIRSFVDAVEDGTLRIDSYDVKAVPIAYYVLGERDNALDFIHRLLKRYSNDSDNRNLLNYQEFFEKYMSSLSNFASD